jgi:hypothetical protein
MATVMIVSMTQRAYAAHLVDIAVGRDRGAGRQLDEVAGHEDSGVDVEPFSVALHCCNWLQRRLERGHGVARLSCLVEGDCCVDELDCKENSHVGIVGNDELDKRRDPKHHWHRACQLKENTVNASDLRLIPFTIMQ